MISHTAKQRRSSLASKGASFSLWFQNHFDNDDPVAFFYFGHFGADFFDNAHRLMSNYIVFMSGKGSKINMQIRTANTVDVTFTIISSGFLALRCIYLFYFNVFGALECNGLHRITPSCRFRKKIPFHKEAKRSRN